MFKFSWIFEPKFRWFLDRFLDSKRKHRFCKNSAPACTGARFLRFRGIWNQQKINKKSMQNKNEKMIGTNCKKYQFWYGFGKGFGRFSEGLEGIKVRSKESFFYINSWDDMPSFGRGLERQDAAMFAQIATVFLRVASLEAAWGWQLLLEPDLKAIWRRFRQVLNQFWLPKWTKLGPKWLTTFSLDPNLVCYSSRPKQLVRYVGIFVS